MAETPGTTDFSTGILVRVIGISFLLSLLSAGEGLSEVAGIVVFGISII